MTRNDRSDSYFLVNEAEFLPAQHDKTLCVRPRSQEAADAVAGGHDAGLGEASGVAEHRPVCPSEQRRRHSGVCFSSTALSW